MACECACEACEKFSSVIRKAVGGTSETNVVEIEDKSHPQHVKEAAYKLDPECWVSYSGKPKAFKQAMEKRRVASLEQAKCHRERKRVQRFSDLA